MHQGMGLDVFNAMPMRRAVHALYECCYSVPLAADLARGRPYADHDALFRQADQLLFGAGGSVRSTRSCRPIPTSAAGRAARSRRPSSARSGTSAPR